jgi:hypothetical protein
MQNQGIRGRPRLEHPPRVGYMQNNNTDGTTDQFQRQHPVRFNTMGPRDCQYSNILCPSMGTTPTSKSLRVLPRIYNNQLDQEQYDMTTEVRISPEWGSNVATESFGTWAHTRGIYHRELRLEPTTRPSGLNTAEQEGSPISAPNFSFSTYAHVHLFTHTRIYSPAFRFSQHGGVRALLSLIVHFICVRAQPLL